MMQVEAMNVPEKEISVRIYYADTDFSGVVYHARYLEFLEKGRTEWLRTLGLSHKDLLPQQNCSDSRQGLVFAVRHMNIDFIKSASIDDFLIVRTKAEQVRGARLFMKQSILRQEKNELMVLLEAAVEIVLMNQNGHPRRFPKDWLEKFFS